MVGMGREGEWDNERSDWDGRTGVGWLGWCGGSDDGRGKGGMVRMMGGGPGGVG